MMKVLLCLTSFALLGAPIPLNDINKDVSFQRYVTVYDPQGRSTVFDLLAPLPEVFVTSEDITLYLFTRTNPTTPTQLPLDADAIATAENFDASKTNVLLVHGWKGSNESDSNLVLRPPYLEALDVNVFVVDWSGPAADELYVSAFASVPEVGRLLGTAIGDLKNSLGLDASQFILVGHSLGAHVVGCAGAALNGSIGIIAGLDPAGPGFFDSITENRLDPSDAHFVQAIHTNEFFLGYIGNLGTVDIRPNGGSVQPGCSQGCSHARSYLYFAESLSSGGFTAWSCESYSEFTNGSCSDNPTTHLGGASIDTSASGEFYLTTNSESPYSQG